MQPRGTYNQLIDEMLLALTANINYLKKNGSSQIRIRNGRLVSVLESGHIYDFQLEQLQEIDVDSDVEVRVGNRSANGKVISISEGKVQVSIDEHLGDDIVSAMLIISNYYLLERLREYLAEVKSGDIAHASTAEKVFHLKESHTELDTSYIRPPKIDASQEKAIQLVLGSDVSFIWGPPGTGKSATIAYLIETLIERKLSVLLIAHTNGATDSVMTKVVELMEEHPDYLDGKFLRIGKRIDEDLKKKLVIPEMIMQEKSRPMLEEKENIRAQMDKLNLQLEYIAKVEALQQKKYDAQQEVASMNSYIQQGESTLSALEVELETLKGYLADCELRISSFQQKGNITRLFSGTNLDKLTKEKTEYVKQVSNKKARITRLNGELDVADENLEVNTGLIQRISVKLDALPLKVDEVLAKSTRKQLKNLDEQIKAIEKQIAELSENLLIEAKVIATTLTQTYISKQLLSRTYDVVILDEASMAPLPAIASVAGIASKKIVLVGDFFQLPPIAKHQVDVKNLSDEDAHTEQKLVDKWLKQDIFELVGIASDVISGKKPGDWLSQLKTQYRMHPDISYIINELVYGKNKDFKLLNGGNTLTNGNALLAKEPLKNSHVGVYDTTSLGAIPTKSDSGSWYNLPHALVAVEMAKKAISSGYTNIGIISAYRAQINIINQIIRDELGDDLQYVEADTVHRFQGGAKQVVIFDVTTPYSNSMYDDGREGGDDTKLINVAFSRAEEKLIILVDYKVVESKHSQSSMIRQACDICKLKGYPFVDAKQHITDYFADDRSETWMDTLTNSKDVVTDVINAKLHDERDFYPLFMRDVSKAQQEVIVQSAFITMTRLNTLIPLFQVLLLKGVRVFVATRVPWEHDGYMREQSEQALGVLEKMGVTVLPFVGKIHQKYAIIDRKVMWDGSLNILSQRDSKEVMRRYEGDGAVKQYMEFMRLDKNIGQIGSNNLKRCKVCKEPGSWMWTKKVRGKMWTFCLTGNHSATMEPKTSADRATREQETLNKRSKAATLRQRVTIDSTGDMVCPEHNRKLIQKNGRFGEYWDCPLSKECGLTVSPAQKRKVESGQRQNSLL